MIVRCGNKYLKYFLVGGAVRDILLKQAPRDHDYVVLNSSVEEMMELGFQPVGSSYQVFLHPQTKEEYVLASNLEEDLARRDLTINSMAMDEKQNVIDPFKGQLDLEQKILRHTSEHFSEDSLRIYRLARFKSQYPDFSIADETLELCKKLAKGDEFKNLKSERILSELEGSLTSTRPSLFFNTLQKVEALSVHFPEVKSWTHLDKIIEQNPALRFAGLLQDLKFEEVLPFCKRMHVSNDWLEAAETANLVYSQLDSLSNMSSKNIVELLYKISGFRKPYLLEILDKLYGAKAAVLLESFEILRGVSINDIAKGIVGKEISVEIKKERVNRLTTKLTSS
jgi:tRNA nucleotidyltransferase (CCA-adding enzyme)